MGINKNYKMKSKLNKTIDFDIESENGKLFLNKCIIDKENIKEYTFRNEKLLKSHYEKHGIEMGFSTEEEYQTAASLVVNNPKALHKKEKEDNDDVYYLEETNEFVIISTDGYIRTYFNPNSGIEYYNRQ